MKYLKKSLGQNFLIDKNIIKKIVNQEIIFQRNVVEIGPGKGALTDEIIKKKPKSLTLIEKDLNLFKELKIKYSIYKNIKIYNSDILKFDMKKIKEKNLIIFGNLPYNISSQIHIKILKFCKWPQKISDIIFMFQKELADRIIGTYPSKNYGRLSILTSYRLKCIKKFFVSPNCFFPKPKIISTVLHLKPKNDFSCNLKKIENLEKITNIFFSNKRKMINKSINKVLNKKKLEKIIDLNLKLRPSELSPKTYYKITELFEND